MIVSEQLSDVVASTCKNLANIRNKEIAAGMHSAARLPGWIRKRSKRGIVTLLGVGALRRFFLTALNYAKGGLQDGIVELGDFTYRGVPVRVH